MGQRYGRYGGRGVRPPVRRGACGQLVADVASTLGTGPLGGDGLDAREGALDESTVKVGAALRVEGDGTGQESKWTRQITHKDEQERQVDTRRRGAVPAMQGCKG